MSIPEQLQREQQQRDTTGRRRAGGRRELSTWEPRRLDGEFGSNKLTERNAYEQKGGKFGGGGMEIIENRAKTGK